MSVIMPSYRALQPCLYTIYLIILCTPLNPCDLRDFSVCNLVATRSKGYVSVLTEAVDSEPANAWTMGGREEVMTSL